MAFLITTVPAMLNLHKLKLKNDNNIRILTSY